MRGEVGCDGGRVVMTGRRVRQGWRSPAHPTRRSPSPQSARARWGERRYGSRAESARTARRPSRAGPFSADRDRRRAPLRRSHPSRVFDRLAAQLADHRHEHAGESGRRQDRLGEFTHGPLQQRLGLLLLGPSC